MSLTLAVGNATREAAGQVGPEVPASLHQVLRTDAEINLLNAMDAYQETHTEAELSAFIQENM